MSAAAHVWAPLEHVMTELLARTGPSLRVASARAFVSAVCMCRESGDSLIPRRRVTHSRRTGRCHAAAAWPQPGLFRGCLASEAEHDGEAAPSLKRPRMRTIRASCCPSLIGAPASAYAAGAMPRSRRRLCTSATPERCRPGWTAKSRTNAKGSARRRSAATRCSRCRARSRRRAEPPRLLRRAAIAGSRPARASA